MSKRDIYREAKRQGLEIVEYERGHSGPAQTFDTSGYWYEVTTRDPDGFEEIHTDSKQFVLEGIRRHGETYRAALGGPQ
ncbi:hypothetical protein [Deinococcus sp. 12RED42]|uniref:hypothetical protein n=1 Tax=Deinococcus sp. 12RED42 TaxID=2745872 RepID=UPI001E5F3802|nr:hypothetical protein [Deinococcus sp. 12RED42]MCD0164605.1 hypothetical protein [Deinococcus sp. 12RED42]